MCIRRDSKLLKLRGSRTEAVMRRGLLAGCAALEQGKAVPHLAEVLRQRFSDYRSAFVLAWTPEQEANLYSVLIDDHCVVACEIAQDGAVLEFTVCTVEDYHDGLRGRRDRLLLAVALDCVARARGAPAP